MRLVSYFKQQMQNKIICTAFSPCSTELKATSIEGMWIIQQVGLFPVTEKGLS